MPISSRSPYPCCREFHRPLFQQWHSWRRQSSEFCKELHQGMQAAPSIPGDTSIFSSLFKWLPEEHPSVNVAGSSTGLLSRCILTHPFHLIPLPFLPTTWRVTGKEMRDLSGSGPRRDPLCFASVNQNGSKRSKGVHCTLRRVRIGPWE